MPSDAPGGSRARVALAMGAGVAAMLLYAGQLVLSRWSMQRTLTLWDLAALRFVVAGLLSLPLLGEVPSALQVVGVAAVCAGMLVTAGAGLDLAARGGRSSPPIGGGR